MAKLLLLTFCFVLAAVVLEPSQAATCVCTNTGTSCDAYSAYITCLKGVTTGNGCTALEATAAELSVTGVETLRKAAGCSGAVSLMTSVGFVLVLTCLAYLFNEKKI